MNTNGSCINKLLTCAEKEGLHVSNDKLDESEPQADATMFEDTACPAVQVPLNIATPFRGQLCDCC